MNDSYGFDAGAQWSYRERMKQIYGDENIEQAAIACDDMLKQTVSFVKNTYKRTDLEDLLELNPQQTILFRAVKNIVSESSVPKGEISPIDQHVEQDIIQFGFQFTTPGEIDAIVRTFTVSVGWDLNKNTPYNMLIHGFTDTMEYAEPVELFFSEKGEQIEDNLPYLEPDKHPQITKHGEDVILIQDSTLLSTDEEEPFPRTVLLKFVYIGVIPIRDKKYKLYGFTH